jgi:hypothetical protein
MQGMRIPSVLAPIAMFAALLMLAAQLVAPAGFMPVRTAQGVVITLCTGQGAVKMAMPHAPAQAPAERQNDGKHCGFAGAVGAPALPAPPIATPLPAWQLATGPIAFALKTGWMARLAAPPPPSSGPPARLTA